MSKGHLKKSNVFKRSLLPEYFTAKQRSSLPFFPSLSFSLVGDSPFQTVALTTTSAILLRIRRQPSQDSCDRRTESVDGSARSCVGSDRDGKLGGRGEGEERRQRRRTIQHGAYNKERREVARGRGKRSSTVNTHESTTDRSGVNGADCVSTVACRMEECCDPVACHPAPNCVRIS